MRTVLFMFLVICGTVLLVAGTAATESTSLTISGTVITTGEPVANFSANQTTGSAPLSVKFTDLSTGSPAEWEWDFEADGTIDDITPGPVHTYALPGIYSVSLTVRNTEGSDTELKLNYITVQEPDPAVRIEALKEYVQGLPIPKWAKYFLITPLDQALKQLDKGHDRPAINQMRLFIHFVELLHRFEILNDEQAGYMTGEAIAIIDLIEG